MEFYEKEGDALTSIIKKKRFFVVVESDHCSITWDRSPSQEMKDINFHETTVAICIHSATWKKVAVPSFCSRWIKACLSKTHKREGVYAPDLADNSYTMCSRYLININ